MSSIPLSIEQNKSGFDALIRSIYTRHAESCIRELIANALDAHNEANIDRKIDVSFDDYFYLRDYGFGISPKQMRESFSVINNSTKRDNDSSTGEYGLGSKTPFGMICTGDNTIDIEVTMGSIHDGIKYIYSLDIEDGNPCYNLIYEKETDEESGVFYYIQPNSTMKSLPICAFMNIFAPIIEKVNFVGSIDYAKYFKKKKLYSNKNLDVIWTTIVRPVITTNKEYEYITNALQGQFLTAFNNFAVTIKKDMEAKYYLLIEKRHQYLYDVCKESPISNLKKSITIGNISYPIDVPLSFSNDILSNYETQIHNYYNKIQGSVLFHTDDLMDNEFINNIPYETLLTLSMDVPTSKYLNLEPSRSRETLIANEFDEEKFSNVLDYDDFDYHLNIMNDESSNNTYNLHNVIYSLLEYFGSKPYFRNIFKNITEYHNNVNNILQYFFANEEVFNEILNIDFIESFDKNNKTFDYYTNAEILFSLTLNRNDIMLNFDRANIFPSIAEHIKSNFMVSIPRNELMLLFEIYSLQDNYSRTISEKNAYKSLYAFKTDEGNVSELMYPRLIKRINDKRLFNNIKRSHINDESSAIESFLYKSSNNTYKYSKKNVSKTFMEIADVEEKHFIVTDNKGIKSYSPKVKILRKDNKKIMHSKLLSYAEDNDFDIVVILKDNGKFHDTTNSIVDGIIYSSQYDITTTSKALGTVKSTAKATSDVEKLTNNIDSTPRGVFIQSKQEKKPQKITYKKLDEYLKDDRKKVIINKRQQYNLENEKEEDTNIHYKFNIENLTVRKSIKFNVLKYRQSSIADVKSIFESDYICNNYAFLIIDYTTCSENVINYIKKIRSYRY